METENLALPRVYPHGFKSYYVVWKLSDEEKMKLLYEGLNRTMQYGNFSPDFGEFREYRFKSYYVVWKPYKDNYSVSENTSLNRTMQYGNLFLAKKGIFLSLV